jgi:GPH family glycoside/pentoside/hexuronide:cation symporter
MKAKTKLSKTKKSAWAMGSIADVYMTNALGYLAFPIYNMGLGVDPRMLGWALGLPRIWDAISDPLMGNISDNTRTRWPVTYGSLRGVDSLLEFFEAFHASA